jgi:hypothetical protein
VFLKDDNLSFFILQFNVMHKVKNLFTILCFSVSTVGVSEMMVWVYNGKFVPKFRRNIMP